MSYWIIDGREQKYLQQSQWNISTDNGDLKEKKSSFFFIHCVVSWDCQKKRESKGSETGIQPPLNQLPPLGSFEYLSLQFQKH